MKKSRIYPYLILIACCGLITITFGFINTQGLFLNSISEDLGVSRASVSLYTTISLLSAAILGSTFGVYLRNKFKIKLILLISGTVIIVAYLMVPRFTNIFSFYLFGFILGGSIGIIGHTLVVELLNEWFERAGTAVGIAMAFSGVFGMLYSPVAVSLIDKYGWRKAYYSYAVIFAVIMIYSVIVVSSNRPLNISVTKKKKESVYNKELLLITPFYIAGGSITTLGNFMLSFALSIGINSSRGALLSSIVSAGNLILKITFGYLSDSVGGLKTAIINAVVVIAGCVGMLLCNADSFLLLIVFSFCVGASYACQNVVSQGICKELFGKVNVGKYYSSLNIFSLMSSFAATVFGLIYDLTTSYKVAILIFLSLFILGFILLLIDIRIVKKNKTSA